MISDNHQRIRPCIHNCRRCRRRRRRCSHRHSSHNQLLPQQTPVVRGERPRGPRSEMSSFSLPFLSRKDPRSPGMGGSWSFVTLLATFSPSGGSLHCTRAPRLRSARRQSSGIRRWRGETTSCGKFRGRKGGRPHLAHLLPGFCGGKAAFCPSDAETGVIVLGTFLLDSG